MRIGRIIRIYEIPVEPGPEILPPPDEAPAELEPIEEPVSPEEANQPESEPARP